MPVGAVAVVGGSIAGCAFASVAARAGADEVVVLERTGGRLADRGVGLCIHDDRAAELAALGTLPGGIAAHRLTRRRWVTRDGAAEPLGKLFWDQPFPFHSYHWGLLWQGLREATPASVVYRQGAAVTAVSAVTDPAGPPASGGDRAVVSTADGSTAPYDLVVGADGYRSVVREALSPGSHPHYAGYVCWRGNFDARLLDGLAGGRPDELWPPDSVTTVCFPGGSCVVYRIPGPEGTRVNWVLYAAPPQDGTLRFDDPTSFPPGSLTPELAGRLAELLDREFPPYWARVLGLTAPEDTFVQPIYDLQVERTAAGRLLLAGDAATVVRPHNTAGAAKALQDACAFEAAWRGAASWPDLTRAYQAARGPVGHDMVALARRLGRAQVERTPDWPTLTPRTAAAWWQTQLGGAPTIGGQSLTRPGPP
ncbi:FAD-dependent monooxygenase [Streptomyces sp. WAC06614]|uniref:FAD-dependent monooxygenase n=1 Tax=Streptomyces sp. WAC06614 TaxID=2487416 RepID=UPI000F78C063|nr:FAD-dependent monooxygenase [Streptomyces sp. WAC06614]RSS81666.1 monooxygenase [Streptomyces sp. WAC06614]